MKQHSGAGARKTTQPHGANSTKRVRGDEALRRDGGASRKDNRRSSQTTSLCTAAYEAVDRRKILRMVVGWPWGCQGRRGVQRPGGEPNG